MTNTRPPSKGGRPSETVTAAGTRDSWVAAEIEVITRKERRVKVKARTRGDLGVHPALKDDGEDNWTVTHVPTGRLVCLVSTLGDAKAILHTCLKLFPTAMKQTKIKALLAELPEWAEQWLDDCREKGGYIDPAPYERGDA